MKKQKLPDVNFSDSLIAIYTAFRDQIYSPKSVLYPSSGFDGSPAKVFDNVTFVDIEDGNEGCVKKLQEAGLHAIKQDIKTYTPKELHDLLILLNPSIRTEWATKHLKSGGYVLANNYHGNASWLNNNPKKFSLLGVIDYIEKEAIIERNGDGNLGKTSPIESIKESRPLEHLMFKYNLRDEYDIGLPFDRVADQYIFVKK